MSANSRTTGGVSHLHYFAETFCPVLERNIRDVVSADNMRLLVPYDDEMDEEEQAFKEAIEERLIEAVDAALTAMVIKYS
ncbi:unnamed protein product [Caenorhabditis angaria]|uniref:Uncharacterized protein n=1 Tax=Caenorhabditis angaria TaxID=860376 RepID=A0A9P1MWP9_9PELO|nr:unnamed protein product [Caenorhabditis angaria]